MEWFNTIYLAISSNIEKVIGVLAVLGIAVDLTPVIKFQPIRFLLKTIGKYFNKDIKDEVASLKEKLEKTEKRVNAHIINVQRQEILAFSNECINKIPHTKEEFDHIIEIHSDYLKNISSENLENGRVDIAYRVIEEDYFNCISNNSFLQRGV